MIFFVFDFYSIYLLVRLSNLHSQLFKVEVVQIVCVLDHAFNGYDLRIHALLCLQLDDLSLQLIYFA